MPSIKKSVVKHNSSSLALFHTKNEVNALDLLLETRSYQRIITIRSGAKLSKRADSTNFKLNLQKRSDGFMCQMTEDEPSNLIIYI